MGDLHFVGVQVISLITSRVLGVSQEFYLVTMLPQLPSTQSLWLVNKNISIPHLHVGDIWSFPKEGLKWGHQTGLASGCSVDGIHSCGKCIGPEEIRGTCILHDGASFV